MVTKKNKETRKIEKKLWFAKQEKKDEKRGKEIFNSEGGCQSLGCWSQNHQQMVKGEDEWLLSQEKLGEANTDEWTKVLKTLFETQKGFRKNKKQRYKFTMAMAAAQWKMLESTTKRVASESGHQKHNVNPFMLWQHHNCYLTTTTHNLSYTGNLWNFIKGVKDIPLFIWWDTKICA